MLCERCNTCCTYCRGIEPYSDAHYQCPECDSTYPLEPWQGDCYHPDFPTEKANDITDIIYWWSRHIGRFGGQDKWKWGRYRFYVFFSDGTLHSLVKPGHYYYRWPRWIRWIDDNIVQRIAKYTGTLYLLHRWQQFIYKVAYKRAVDKYPELRDEILCDADFHELVEGIHGFRHLDHWITLGGSDD